MSSLDHHPHANAKSALQTIKKTLVIKYGGNAMTDTNLKQAFASDIALLHHAGIRMVVVHGGGPQVDDMLTKIGHHSTRIDGMRVTDATTMTIAEMVLGAQVNGELVNLINHASATGIAIGINGKDAQCMIADKLISAVDLGYVGAISQIDTALLDTLLTANFVPVFAPIATNKDATINYNINADTVAGALAQAMDADELIMLSNIDGVLDENKSLIHCLDFAAISDLIAKEVIYGGMIPKLSGAMDAIQAGVKSVVILNGQTPHAMIDYLLGKKIGTKIIA